MAPLTQRGANANAPVRLPGLQAARIDDPGTRQAVEALREWVEVRLGSRGDRYERAVTFRDYEPQITAILARLDALAAATGGATSSTTTAPTSGDLAEIRNKLTAAVSEYTASDVALRAQLQAVSAALDSGVNDLRGALREEADSFGRDLAQLRALVAAIRPSGAETTAVNVFTASQVVEEVTLTDASTVAINAALSNNFQLTLGGNRIIDNPTNLHKGGVVNLVLRQDGTGSRTVTWGSKWDFGAVGTPVLSTGANKVDFVSAYYNATADKLLAAFRKSA